ncbi:MAG: hypothetical protein ACXVRQ_06385 [Gaiellaceae bacterium]
MVAGDARKRLREPQVGSPVELKLTLTRPYPDRRDADAVAAELYRCFASRRDRGSWYRLTVAEVRERLGRRATLEAPARARAAAKPSQSSPTNGCQMRGRSPTERRALHEVQTTRTPRRLSILRCRPERARQARHALHPVTLRHRLVANTGQMARLVRQDRYRLRGGEDTGVAGMPPETC